MRQAWGSGVTSVSSQEQERRSQMECGWPPTECLGQETGSASRQKLLHSLGSRHFSETSSRNFTAADEVVRLSGHFLNKTLRMVTAHLVRGQNHVVWFQSSPVGHHSVSGVPGVECGLASILDVG